MEVRTRRALLRLIGAAAVVLGVFLTATAVRRADQVVASGREILLGGEMVDVFTARDLRIAGHAQLTGTAVALGDLDVPTGSLRVDRDTARVFAVGGTVEVGESASVVFPAVGDLQYGTIRSGASGGRDTVLRDTTTVARYAAMVGALESSSVCFSRAATTGIVRYADDGMTLVGDGASGLQVFNVDRALTGPITVSRIPRHASVLVNLTGSAVEIGPSGAGWTEIAPSTLVNVADAMSVSVHGNGELRLNALVGSTAGEVVVDADRLVGTLLSLSGVVLGDVQLASGPLLAPMLPDCAQTLDEPADELATPARFTSPVSEPSASISTSTSSSTTTTTVLGGVEVPGSRPVPGAAFALGGAATASHWWIGVPVALAGGVLLGWTWIHRQLREQRARLRHHLALARVERRMARHG